MERLLDLQREQEFVEVEERLEEDQVHAAVEQRADLFAEHGAAVDALFARLVGGDPQRADAARDVNALPAPRRPAGRGGRRPC